MNIELQAALQTIALGQDDHLLALLDIGAKSNPGVTASLVTTTSPLSTSGIRTAGQPEIGVRGRTYARGITQANIMRGRAEIEEEASPPW